MVFHSAALIVRLFLCGCYNPRFILEKLRLGKEELSLRRWAPIISVNKQPWILHGPQMLPGKYLVASVWSILSTNEIYQ